MARAGFPMKVEADFKPMIRDLRRVQGEKVPRLVPSVLNTVGRRKVEAPAIKNTAQRTGFRASLIRWKHDAYGKRTKRKRIVGRPATRGDWSFRWGWATRTGRAGMITLGSVPGRRQTGRGLRAGPTFTPGGFINVSRRSGTPIAMKRTGARRYPVRVLRVDISSEADAAFETAVQASGRAFVVEFERRLARALRRR